jgi:hypothetical protein
VAYVEVWRFPEAIARHPAVPLYFTVSIYELNSSLSAVALMYSMAF